MDAEVHIGERTRGEVVVIRIRGAVAAHPASVIRPLLLPDSPVVIWWPGKAPQKHAADELAQLAMRRSDWVALKRRESTDLISEELRRMDEDEVYERTVKSLLELNRRPAANPGPRPHRAGKPVAGRQTAHAGSPNRLQGGTR